MTIIGENTFKLGLKMSETLFISHNKFFFPFCLIIVIMEIMMSETLVATLYHFGIVIMLLVTFYPYFDAMIDLYLQICIFKILLYFHL